MNQDKPDYKDSIHLPQTDFPMRGNLPQREPEMIQWWEKNSIYEKMVAKNKGKGAFTMPDGPPYANGSIHIGHAFNKILKDMVIKFHNMTGKSAPFIPGWDCHGLPIEHKVSKDLGKKRAELTDSELRDLCRKEALKWVNHQQDQFIRLGVLADWKNRYLTMDNSYEAEEIRELARAIENGVIYRGEKPVYWCWALQTALADAEVEYHQHRSPSIYVKFYVEDQATLEKLGLAGEKLAFVIWTTTPWTLPANLAIAVHPEFKYKAYKTSEGEHWVIAEGLKESFEAETDTKLSEGPEFKGQEFEGLKARHPFIDRDSLLILGDHVSLEAGTGCVHTAPGHGQDDYIVGLKYGLDVLSPVDEKGCYTSEVPEYEGMQIFKANPEIVERLRSSGHLIAHKEIEHSYPHCWRSKTPLIFRATPQWFLGLDIEGNSVRKQALEAINDIRFFPEWGRARLTAMMENRPDWCLSRQRIWGVPIPVFYCKATGKALADPKVMRKVADIMEKEDGIEAYHRHPVEDFVDSSYVDGEFGSKGFERGRDILDVWFDSGICHAAVQKKREGLEFPADIYLEGSDQHRGWFNTSLLSSIATNKQAPFKALITHGFVNDSEGKKMSKSKGNTVDPMDTAKTMGAEILRLWTAYEDYGQDLRCGQEELQRVTETYRRIRNTMKYLLGVLYDFDRNSMNVSYQDLTPIDQWVLGELYNLNTKVVAAYESYSFYKVYHLLNNFFTVTLSAIYLDSLKDRLYTGKKDGLARRSSQTTIDILTRQLIGLMAPILSFLAEESYGYLKDKEAESVFLTDFPTVAEEWNNSEIAARFAVLLEVRSEASKKLESLRREKVIGSSLEADLKIQAEGKMLQELNHYANGLRELFIVSSVTLTEGPFAVEAMKSQGEKCPRCWHFATLEPNESKHPGVCSKCFEALE